MNHLGLKLFAVTAALTLSAAQAQPWLENVPFDAAAGHSANATFEESYPASSDPDAALSMDLPADYFSEISFPPMSDLVIDELPVMLASLDPTETP